MQRHGLGGSDTVSASIQKMDIQSLVFSGHGRLRESLAIGLCVNDRVSARGSLRDVAETAIAFGLSRDIRTSRTHLLLSASGIRTLDSGEAHLSPFPFAFKQGIITPQRSRALGDTGKNDPSTWAWQDQRTHALLLIYAWDGDTLRRESEKVLSQLRYGWEKVFELPIGLPKHSREPYGFRDGISKERIDTRDGASK